MPGTLDASASHTTPRIHGLKSQTRKPGEASFFYTDAHFQYDAVKVLPGEYFVCKDDLMVMTVLGSCIATCLWDDSAHVGGMNHFMLPDGDEGESNGRYGSYAMEILINEILKLGGRRENLQAKVFGGGQVMAGIKSLNVGERNTRFAIDYLAAERIPLVSQDVLDIHPRKVCFFPLTGKALVKRLAHTHPEKILAQEAQVQLSSRATARVGGGVDLFSH